MSNSVGSVDPQSIAVIVGALIAAVAAITAGIIQGIKNARKNEPDAGMRIMGASIMDNATLLRLSDELGDLRDAVDRSTHATERNTEAVTRCADKTIENTAELRLHSRK